MLRIAVLSFLLLAGPAVAQDRAQTLADIRQELTVLFVEIQKLKRELSTTGAPSTSVGGATTLDRVNLIESELQRLTLATEELTNRVNRVVQDGTNRIGDLEFRLVELEGGDLSQLGETTTLGGETDLPVSSVITQQPSQGVELAVGEQADFDAAKAAYDSGSYESAVIQFATFTESYPGGPLSAEAHFWRGKALSALGNVAGAARAYLDAFSGLPSGPMAPAALLELGLALDSLGQSQEACLMLAEVTGRFPASEASVNAQAARASMGCT